MSLQPVGVDLFAAGAEKFTVDIDRAARAAEVLGNSMRNQAAPGMDEAVTKGVLLGNVLTRVFDMAVSSVTNFVRSGIAAVEGLQDMQVGLETLVSRELLYSKATDNMADALEMSTPIAENLMERLKDLSIQSPFQQSQIMSVFRMNMAFGQTSAMSLELTRAITNLGAANKGIPGILERLSYNFSQMSMVGKITGRDIRDLAMAGLDLEKVFGLTLQMSVKEVNAALEQGKLTFEDVSKALVKYTDEYVGPAAERASKTLGGLKSTMADVVFFAAGNLFKGAAENVTEALGGIMAIGLKIVDSKVFTNIGLMLEALTEPLQKFGEKISKAATQAEDSMKALEGVPEAVRLQIETQMGMQDKSFAVWLTKLEDFGDKMLDKAMDAFAWGLEIATQFASGMIQGAADGLIAAMDFIGGILSSFLESHSPPRVAPNLGAWGAAAFESYLEGFSAADFSMLDAIQRPLQQALQYSLGSDVLAAEGMMDISNLAAKALAGQADPSQVFDLVASKTKMFGSEVAELIESQFKLAKATDIVRKAEQALLDLRKKETEESTALNKLVAEYNQMLVSGASKEALQAKMAEIQAGRQGLFTTKAQGAAAEQALVTAQMGLQPLQEQLQAQDAIVKQLMEMAGWQKKIDMEAARKGAGGKGGGVGTKEPPEPPKTIDDIVNTKLEELKEKIRLKLADAFAPVRKAWEEEIGPAIDRLSTKWQEFTVIWDEFYNKYVKPAIDGFTTWAQDNEIVEKLGYVVGILLVANVLFSLFGWILNILVSPAVKAFTIVIGIATKAMAIWNLVMALGLGPILLIAAGLIFLTWAWNSGFGGIKENVEMLIEIIVRWAFKYVIPIFVNIITRLKSFYDHWKTVFDDLDKVWEAAKTKFTELKDRWLEGVKIIKEKVDEFLKPVTDTFNNIKQAVQNVIDIALKLIKTFTDIKLPWWLTPGSPTPLELGLVGIAGAMDLLSGKRLPKLRTEMVNLQSGAGAAANTITTAGGGGVVQNFSYTLNQNNMPGAPARSMARDMRTIQMVSKLTTPRYHRNAY